MAENGNEKGGQPSMVHGHMAYVAGAAKVGLLPLLSREHVRALSRTLEVVAIFETLGDIVP